MSRILPTILVCSSLVASVGAQGQLESNEPGNDASLGAEAASPNGQCYGHLESASPDKDFWSFTITSPKRLTTWTSRRGAKTTENGGTATSDTVLEVYDPNGFFIGYNDDFGGGKYSLVSVDLPVAGTYYIAVATFVDPYIPGFANGDYALDIICEDPAPAPTYSTAPTESEPNDACASAESTSGGTEHFETLQSIGDSDYYTFTLNRRARVTIETHADTSTTGAACTDPKLWLYDAGCVELSSDDNGGSGSQAMIEQVLEPGTYSVEVSDHQRNAAGDYRLTVDVTILSTQDILPGSPNCPGTSGQPLQLLPREGELPRVGSQVTVDVANVPAGPCAVLLGVTAPPAPLDLTIVGAPGCDLAVNVNLGSFACQPTVAGEAEFGIHIGSVPFPGIRVFAQAAGIDIGANALGVILSAPLRWTIGAETY
ncbi:MAG: PPC domain-containing protein [Planctomycetes bacterium]|nr:PPC domain-containing protein [Planctomycetota bacterium]